MPIYEFECAACGTRFDRLQKLSDPDPTDCPTCAAPRVHRRVTAPAFRLSGSGWYETDFKKDGDKKRNLTAKNEAAKPPAADAASKSEAPAKAASASPAPAPAKPPSSDA
jgi:putative FmdB family regulatory protein